MRQTNKRRRPTAASRKAVNKDRKPFKEQTLQRAGAPPHSHLAKSFVDGIILIRLQLAFHHRHQTVGARLHELRQTLRRPLRYLAFADEGERVAVVAEGFDVGDEGALGGDFLAGCLELCQHLELLLGLLLGRKGGRVEG